MKRLRRALIAAVLVMGMAAYGVYWAFYDIQRLAGHDVLCETASPDGKYVITAYLTNGGATTDYGVLCAVHDVGSGRTKNIYWQYHCNKADVRWIDEDTAEINGVVLDVWENIYDYRHSEQAAGT